MAEQAAASATALSMGQGRIQEHWGCSNNADVDGRHISMSASTDLV